MLRLAVWMKDEAEIDAMLAGFEAGSLSKSEWTHAAHLTVATCYLLSHSNEATLDLLRTRIRFLNDRHGTLNSLDSGYHETLTRFWLAVLRRFLSALPPDAPRATVIKEVVAAFGERKNLYEEYYSFDLVKSQRAQLTWISPDKQNM